MAIPTVCPQCQTEYALADHLAGKIVRCKSCGGPITVRRIVEDSGQQERVQREPRSAKAATRGEEPPPRRRRRDSEERTRSSGGNTALVIGLLGCGLLLCLLIVAGGIGMFFILSSSETTSTGPPPVPVPQPMPVPPGADSVTRALIQLKSNNQHERREAVRILKDTLPDERRAEVSKALEPLMNETDHFTREWAIEALGVWGNKDTVPILLRAMNAPETRSAAMLALARLKDERAAEPIAQRLEEFHEHLQAAEALKKMGPIAEDAVLKRLNYPNFHTRLAVCDILQVIGTPQKSIPALEKVRNGSDFIMQQRAEQTIKAIKARQG